MQPFIIQDGYAYIEFTSEDEAKSAQTKYQNIFSIEVDVNPPLNSPRKATAPKQMPETTEIDGSWQEEDRPTTHASISYMGWRPFLEFLKESKKCLSEPYKFDKAGKIGSVSTTVEMAYSTPCGNRLGTGFIGYMSQAHLAGMSWAGMFRQIHLVVSNSCLCMIDLFPYALATDENMKKDRLVLIKHLFKLYEINGRMPAYFDDLIEKLRNPPKDAGNVVENLKALSLYYLKLLNHSAFASEEKICFLLQEINVNCKDLDEVGKTAFGSEFSKGATPTDLIRFVQIDNLLQLVCRMKEGQKSTFADEGCYQRHLVNHSSEKIQASLIFFIV